jgi:23S rRNA pseudouridine1911/1915/1917 synthase
MAGDPRDGEFVHPVDGAPERLDRVVRAHRPQLSWSDVRDLIARGKVFVGTHAATDPGSPVAPGAQLSVRVASRMPASTLASCPELPSCLELIVHCDHDVVVVRKPSGLSTVPWGDEPDALVLRLAAELGKHVHVVHRLDRDTSGLLVFARNAAAEAKLAHQLRRHTVQRRYLALAHGDVSGGTIRSFLADDRGDGLRGSIANRRVGKEAITHVAVAERLCGATLVECRLETGRTHQIRIHLAEAGHMLLGERAYVREHRGPVLPAPRIMLHAGELGFVHPQSGRETSFREPMPPDMAARLDALRARG